MLRCPHCGSTAQVRELVNGAYVCGCGQFFYEVNGKILTANEICERVEKVNKVLPFSHGKMAERKEEK